MAGSSLGSADVSCGLLIRPTSWPSASAVAKRTYSSKYKQWTLSQLRVSLPLLTQCHSDCLLLLLAGEQNVFFISPSGHEKPPMNWGKDQMLNEALLCNTHNPENRRLAQILQEFQLKRIVQWFKCPRQWKNAHILRPMSHGLWSFTRFFQERKWLLFLLHVPTKKRRWLCCFLKLRYSFAPGCDSCIKAIYYGQET